MENQNTEKKKVSSKRAMLQSAEVFYDALQETLDRGGSGKHAKILLLTQSGIIKGTPASENEANAKEPMTILPDGKSAKINLFSLGYQHSEFMKSFKEEYPSAETIDNGTYLMLKNATFTTNQFTNKFSELIVFADEILGFSIVLED